MSFESLKGKTLVALENNNDKEIIFMDSEGKNYTLFHSQDCCESVYVEDIIGNIGDVLNNPILMAEEVSNKEEQENQPSSDDSFTWTFYKLGTVKGSTTIRWFGTSNGYYSESVDFA